MAYQILMINIQCPTIPPPTRGLNKNLFVKFNSFISYLNHKIDNKINYLKITKCTKTCTHVLLHSFYTNIGTIVRYSYIDL